MEVKLLGICVRAEDFGEQDKIITLVTLERGRITVSAKSARKISSKLKIACSLLSYGEYTLMETRNKYILTGFIARDSFMPCWQDLEKYAASQSVIETLDKITQEGAPCEMELKLALIALTYISHSASYPFIYSLWFLVNIFPVMGIDLDSLTYFPSKDIDYMKSVLGLEPEYLDSLDVSFEYLSEVFSKINYILLSESSLKLKSILETIKLIKTKET